MKEYSLGQPAALSLGQILNLYSKLWGQTFQSEPDQELPLCYLVEVRVFHRPHPSTDTDKGAVNSIRNWLDLYGVRP